MLRTTLWLTEARESSHIRHGPVGGIDETRERAPDRADSVTPGPKANPSRPGQTRTAPKQNKARFEPRHGPGSPPCFVEKNHRAPSRRRGTQGTWRPAIPCKLGPGSGTLDQSERRDRAQHTGNGPERACGRVARPEPCAPACTMPPSPPPPLAQESHSGKSEKSTRAEHVGVDMMGTGVEVRRTPSLLRQDDIKPSATPKATERGGQGRQARQGHTEDGHSTG